MAKTISQRTLDRLRREWQKRLALRDWKIKIDFVSREQLAEIRPDIEAWGVCDHFLENKEARIHILRPEDWGEEPEDVEDTVVHELLHCHFAPFQAKQQPLEVAQEQAIRAITRALVEVKRGK